MTNEELITGLRHIAHTMERNGHSYYQHVAEDAIKALEQQPCEDCISRKMAVEAVAEALKNTFVEYEDIAKKIIGKLPSVTPQRPKGKWIYKMQVMNNPYTYKCSVCKGWEKDKTKYCPNCGAEMSGGEAE